MATAGAVTTPGSYAGIIYMNYDGNIYRDGTLVTNVTGIFVNDIIGLAYDPIAQTLKFYKNNTLLATVSTSVYGSTPLFFIAGDGSSNAEVGEINFGQRPFVYTPPAGYASLFSKNLTTSSIKRGETGFDVATYTGNGGNIQVGEYQFPRPNYLIGKSLRFKGTNSYLNRSFSVMGNTRIWSWTGWVKRSRIGGADTFLNIGISGQYDHGIAIDTDDRVVVWAFNQPSYAYYLKPNRVIRDSNWHHIIVSCD